MPIGRKWRRRSLPGHLGRPWRRRAAGQAGEADARIPLADQNAFAGKNIQRLAPDVPDSMLGRDPVIGVWATVSVRRENAPALLLLLLHDFPPSWGMYEPLPARHADR